MRLVKGDILMANVDYEQKCKEELESIEKSGKKINGVTKEYNYRQIKARKKIYS